MIKNTTTRFLLFVIVIMNREPSACLRCLRIVRERQDRSSFVRQVQLMATQSVRDKDVACVMQSFSLLILYRNNDYPKANCYVAGWQQELMYKKVWVVLCF